MAYRKIITCVMFCFAFTICGMNHKDRCSQVRTQQLNNLKAFQEHIQGCNETQIEDCKKILKNELEGYKISLLGKKEQLFDALANKCSNKDRWNECRRLIEGIDYCNEFQKNGAMTQAIHDNTLPAHILDSIKKELTYINIDPNYVFIRNVANVNYMYTTKTHLSTICYVELDEDIALDLDKNNDKEGFILSDWQPQHIDKDTKTVITKNCMIGLDLNTIIPAKITVNSQELAKLPPPARRAFYVRMMEDLLHNHSAVAFVIEKMAPLLTDNVTSFLASKEFIDLKNFYSYEISVLLPCLRDPKHIANMLRAIYEYPETPTAWKEYELLSSIKNCIEKMKTIESKQ